MLLPLSNDVTFQFPFGPVIEYILLFTFKGDQGTPFFHNSDDPLNAVILPVIKKGAAKSFSPSQGEEESALY